MTTTLPRPTFCPAAVRPVPGWQAPPDEQVTAGPVHVWASFPAPRTARFTFTAPTLIDQPFVLRHNGEMAMALHHAGCLSEDMPVEQVLVAIVRGVLAVGVERIRADDLASRALNGRMLREEISVRQWRSAPERVWSVARETLCTDLAGHALYALCPPDTASARPGAVTSR